MLSLWHTHGSAPGSSYLVCQKFGSMETFGDRAENEMSSDKKNGGIRASIVLFVGAFFFLFLCFVGSATQVRPRTVGTLQKMYPLSPDVGSSRLTALFVMP